MADVNANIGVNIDTSEALAQLKSLQRQISTFHTSIAKSSETAALAQQSLAKNLINSINSIGAFSAELRTVKTTSESFTDSLEKNKFSMREYFRYAGGATKTFGKLFKSEFDTISNVAEERVKRLQTQYIKLGRDSSGAMKSIAVMPTSLNMEDYNTKLQIAAQRQQLFNQLMRQGSTNLINFGKNTQWAGRQLMVGFTIPLSILGNTASRAFMEMETQAIKFRKVYGDLFTPREETQKALEDVQALASMFTKYGVSASQTVGLAAEAAAAGFSGIDLQRQTTEATRLSVLGQIDSQKALETTISLQNAFAMSSDKLAESIDFLNAVENQTVVSLDDITTAIPKVGPIIQQLGGNVKDLAFFMAAMKEGGVNASEGANALKSGLAALINPTEKASAMLASMGINIKGIIEANKGNLKNTVVEFAKSLDTLDPLARARAIEQLFGKFQFARLSALFSNVTQSGNQASRVLDLAGSSIEELAALSEQELEISASSSMNKFKKAMEDLRIALVPVGETFLNAITPIVDFIGKILERFNDLSSGTKRVITILTVGLGAVGPVLLMTFGLLANGIGNLIKLFLTLRGGYQRLTGQTSVLGQQTQYMTSEQLDAAAAAHSLDQAHAKLTQQFLVEAGAVMQLRNAYQSAIKAGQNFALNNPGSMIRPKKLAQGIVSVPGSGNRDTVPAMLTPGEAVIPKKMAQKYGGLINGMIADNIPGYEQGRGVNIPVYAENAIRLQNSKENMSQQSGGGTGLYNVLANLAARVGESRGIPVTQKRIASGQFDDITEQYRDVTQRFVDELNNSYDNTFSEIKNTNERYAAAWQQAGRSVESEVNNIQNDVERGAVRRVFGLDEDIYATIPTAPRSQGGNMPERARKGAFKTDKFGISSYTKLRPGVKALYERQSGESAANLQMGHVFSPKQVDINQLMADPQASSSVRSAARVMGIEVANNAVEGIQQGAQQVLATASPSKKLKKIGQDAGQGLILGVQESVDDVRLVGQQIGAGIGAGLPTSTASLSDITAKARFNRDQLLATQQAKLMQAMNIRMERLNRAFMSGTFALSTLSGVGSMASGTLGEISSQIFKYSGLLFGLMSITQLLTQAKIAELAATRLSIASNAVRAARGGFGIAGGRFSSAAGFLGQLARAGVFIKNFLGPIGAAIGVTTLLVVGFKKMQQAQEDARKKVLAFGNSLKTSKDQAESTGEYFGVRVKKSPLEQDRSSQIETGRYNTEFRKQLDDFQASEGFKKDYAQTIKDLRILSDADAKTSLLVRIQNLMGQGYSEEQIQIIISSLQEAAGKTGIKLNFKDLQIDTINKDVIEGLKPKLAELAKFSGGKGLNKQSVTTYDAGTGKYTTKEVVTQTKEYSLALENVGASIQEVLKNLSLLQSEGKISTKDLQQAFNGLMYNIKTQAGDSGTQILLLNKSLEGMSDPLAKAALLTEDLTKKTKLMNAAMLNAVIPTAMLNAYLFDAGSGLYSQGTLSAEIDKIIAKAGELNDKFKKAMESGKKTTTSTEDSWLTKLGKQTGSLLVQTEAFYKMRDAGIEASLAMELASNPDFAQGIKDAANGTAQSWSAALAAIKKYKEAQDALKLAEIAGMNRGDYELQRLNKAQAYIDLQSHFIKMEYSAQLESIENSQQENDLLLQRISYQETLINNRYNPIIDRLQKIEALNKSISEIESRRLDVVSALSSGDVSGGIKALQELRATRASQTAQSQIDNLNAAKERELSLVTQNNLTREQLELQNQKLSLDKREIDAIISKRENALTYFNMTKTQIDNAARALDLAKSAGIDIASPTFLTNVLDAAIGKTNSLRLAADEAAKSFAAMLGKQETARTQNIPSLAPNLPALPQIFTTMVGGTKITTPFDIGAGQAIKRSMGGMVPKYFANGGMSRGTDTIPAMLTPGEFVIRKSTVDQLGVNTLTNLNNGNSSLGSVYNYSLSVNVDGTSANANDIARVVMSEIKKVDSQRIRGVR